MTSVSPSDRPIASEPEQADNWQIKLLYDGDCPLCMREVNFLQAKDAGRGLVKFVDIADDSYTPAEHGDIDFETAMGRIHALLPDGTIIKNVEVFRRIYSILGIGWMYAPTRWPIISPIVDLLYDLWADLRLRVTGRPSLKTLVAERKARLQCDAAAGRCRI
ncbi:MAG: thiol-disulfide oxidoreductase DCC family protein [Leptolyngbyaceae cyanobacterium]